MKKMIFAVLVMFIFCSNIGAVYHKIGHYPTDNLSVDGELIGDNLFLLELEKITILDVSNPANPEIISETLINSLAQDIVIQDNVAYIGGLNRIDLFDISDLENLLLLSTIPVNGCVSLSVNNGNLYAACGQEGIYFIDISNPQSPIIEAHYGEYWRSILIDTVWPAAYVDNYENAINIFNIEDINNIELVGVIPSYSDHFIIYEDKMYTNAEQNCINVFDLSNPLNPIQLTSLEGVGSPLTVDENVLYTRGNGIDVFQIDDNFELSPLGMYDSWAIVEGFEVSNGIAFDITLWEGLQILDFSDPIEEKCIGSCELFNSNGIPICPVDINLYEDALYVAYDSNELAGIIDISSYENPIYQQFPNQDDRLKSFTLWDEVLFAKDWFNIFTYDLFNPLEPQLLETFECIQGSNMLLTMDDILIEFDYSEIKLYSINNSTQISEIGQYDDIGYKTAYEASNGIIFYAIYQEGIKVIDIENPERIDFYPIEESENEIILLDIADPTSISLITSIQPHEDSEFRAPAIIDGNDLIIADASWNEISVYDISIPTIPTLIENYNGCREVREMLMIDDFLLTGNNRSGFAIITLEGLLESDENEIIPISFNLKNYPNPFNPSTTINFSIQSNTDVELTIFNIKGQKVKTLIDRNFEKGEHSVIWDGSDETGNSVSSGIYLYRLKTKYNQKMNRMLLLK
jgi:hypothetical protein